MKKIVLFILLLSLVGCSQPITSETTESQKYLTEGDSIILEGVEYTINKYTLEYYTPEYIYYCDKGQHLAKVSIHIKNYNDFTVSYSGDRFLCYADNVATSKSWFAEQGEMTNFDLTSGREGNLVCYFCVPDETSVLEIEFVYNRLSDKRFIILYY